MFKKCMSFVLLVTLLFTTLVQSFALTSTDLEDGKKNDSIVFTVGIQKYKVGSSENSMDVAPFIDKNNRLLLPLRYFAYAINISPDKIRWNGKDVNLSNGFIDAKFTVNKSNIVINGINKPLPTVPVIFKSRVFVPIRAAELLGYKILWNPYNKSVTMKPDITPKPTNTTSVTKSTPIPTATTLPTAVQNTPVTVAPEPSPICNSVSTTPYSQVQEPPVPSVNISDETNTTNPATVVKESPVTPEPSPVVSVSTTPFLKPSAKISLPLGSSVYRSDNFKGIPITAEVNGSISKLEFYSTTSTDISQAVKIGECASSPYSITAFDNLNTDFAGCIFAKVYYNNLLVNYSNIEQLIISSRVNTPDLNSTVKISIPNGNNYIRNSDFHGITINAEVNGDISKLEFYSTTSEDTSQAEKIGECASPPYSITAFDNLNTDFAGCIFAKVYIGNKLVNYSNVEQLIIYDPNRQAQKVDLLAFLVEIAMKYIAEYIKLPNLEELIKLPTLDELVKLPNIDELIKLPNIDELIKLPTWDELIKILNKIIKLPIPNIEEFIKLPNLEELIKLPNFEELIKLPNFDQIIKLPNLEEFIKLPNIEELIKLPNIEELVKLPNIEELIKLPNIEELIKLPNIEELIKLPDFDQIIKLPNIEALIKLPNIEDLIKQLKIELPTIELPKIDLPKIELPKIELPTIELPKIELPTIELPKIDLPTMELPKIELPKIELPKIELPKIELPKFW